MPDFLRIASVTPDLASLPNTIQSALEHTYPDPSDDLLTWDDLQERVLEIAKAHPRIDLRVLYEARIDWFDLLAIGSRDGKIWYESFTLSTAEDEGVEPSAEFAPEVTIALDTSGDRLVDIVQRYAGEYDACTANGETLRLPMRYDAPLDALAIVAGHLANESERFIVMFEDAYYLAELRRGNDVTLRGLHVWHSDPTLRREGREAMATPRSGTFTQKASRAPEITEWDPKRPLTTGSASKREQAALEMMPMFTRHENGWGIDPFVKPTDPALMATLIEAVRAPENAGPVFASVRTRLYGYIADFKAIEAGRALIALLDQETESEMRLALYELIARRRGKNPGRVLVRAYREEKGIQRKLGEMLWKHEAAIEILVREELVPKWKSEPEYAKQILKLLERELIPVPAAWIAGADRELVSALGSLVRSETSDAAP